MQSISSVRSFRILTILLPAFAFAACGQGDGKEPILGTPAPPPPPPPPAACNDAITFEDVCPAVMFTEFEGGVGSIVDNPEQGTSNPSAKVGQMQKFAATSGATFGGSTLTLPTPLNVTAGSSFTMKVWSQRSVRVLFQPEPQGPGSGIEITHGGTGWEELTFSLPGLSGSVTGITLIFDNGTLGAAASDPTNWTFYFDDITLVPPGGGGGGGGAFAAVTFDDAALTYTLRGFGGAEDSSLQADPTDAGNQVVRVNRAADAQTFAGTVVSTGANESIGVIPLDASNTTMSMRVYSPAAGIQVRLKVENSNDDGISVETEATTTVANAWETLTFDFTVATNPPTAAFDPAATYDKAIVFFNFGTDGATAGAQTFFFDDLDVGPGGGGGGAGAFAAVTFDDAALTYTLRGFGGAEDSSLQADPTDAGNQVVRVNRAADAQTFAGTVVSTGANESIGVIPLDASNTTMSMRVYSPAAGIQVRLKVENSNDDGISVETEATTTVANAWETLTFDFTVATNPPTAAFDPVATYDKAIVFFNFGTDGATAGAQTFFFDDLDVGPGGGGGGGAFAAVTFDDAALTYTLRGFGGAEDSSLQADPTDAGNQVVRVNRAADAQTFAGTVVSTGPNESIPVIPLDASNTQMSLRVYSPAAGIQVRLKVENSNDDGISVETEATTTVADTWETLTFDFTVATNPPTAAFDPAATYDKVVIFLNFGTDGATAGAQTFYFDDLDVVGGAGGGGGSASTDFEGAPGDYTFNDFEGGVATIIANPDSSGINTSAQVAQMQKFAGMDFGGSTLDLGGSVPLAAGDSYKVKVRASRSVEVTLKLEPLGDETTATHSGSGTWEELCFDFSGVSGDVTGLTLIFDNGTQGDAGNNPADWTFQFDEIEQTSETCPTGGGGGGFAAITFDDAATTYTLRGFGGAEGSVVTNDPAGGTNMVVQVNRAADAATFAGTVVSTGANESVPVIPLDATNTQMSVRVYSPAAGIQVRLKVENSNDAGISVETEATTTVVNDWETLVFDFTVATNPPTAAFNPAATYDKVIVFFNFGTDGATAGAQTFYFDDIDVVTGSGGGGFAPVTFDDTALTYALRGFGGAEDSSLQNDPSGGSNQVVRVNRAADAATFAGTVVSTGPNESVPVIPLDATNTQMSLRVYSPAAGIQVRLKVENSNDAGVSVETEATTTVANTWETLTFDFTVATSPPTAAFNPAASYDKVIVFFNFGTDGATAGAQTFYFDDIDVVAGSGGGGGGGGGGSASAITFDDAGTTYTFRGFGGAEDTTIQPDPTGGGNMVGRVNRAADAATFAGTVVSTGPNESIPVLPLDATNTTMTVRVYSPAAGIQVRLKVENSGDPTISVETESTTTVANAWETLTFDFTVATNPPTAAFNPASTYDKVVIFFNFGAEGAVVGAQTFYFDDIDAL